jgi:hypothetical protein
LLCVLPSWLKPNAADYGSEHQGLVQQPRDYASLRWNDGEFHNIFLGKTRLRTFLYTNMLLEVWANPALGIRALFLRGAPSGEAPGATSAFVETRGGAKKKMHFVKDLTEKTSDFCRWMSCASIASALWLASGYAKDVSGSSDHPALSRIAGSTIVVYERKDQAEIRIPLERVIFDLQTRKFNAFKTISASGRLTRILYALPDGSTPQAAAGYYENTLRQANCEVLFSGAQNQLDNGNDRFVNQAYYGDLPERTYNLLLLNRENAYLAGKLNWNGRDLYVRLYTFANREGHGTNLVKKDRVGALGTSGCCGSRSGASTHCSRHI